MIAVFVGDSGSGRAPLVYVPGIDGTGELLLETAGRLAERFRLLRLAYRPGGKSGYAELARSAVARLDEAGIARALVLAESFGVAVALTLALEAPERVAGLALVNGFARFDRSANLGASRALACPPSRIARSPSSPLKKG